AAGPAGAEEAPPAPGPSRGEGLMGALAAVVHRERPAGDRLAWARQARQRHGEIDVGRADYRDAGHTRSRKVSMKRAASTLIATRQFGRSGRRPDAGRRSATDMPRVVCPLHSTTT